jgi:hypothetical protein
VNDEELYQAIGMRKPSSKENKKSVVTMEINKVLILPCCTSRRSVSIQQKLLRLLS